MSTTMGALTLVSEPGDGISIVFGRESRSTVDLSALGGDGFHIRAEPESFLRIAPAGDVNGDGVGDVIVGNAREEVAERGRPGAAYVIWGQEEAQDLDLSSVAKGQSTRGFRIIGPEDFTLTGQGVDSVGDLNEDGLSDVVISSPFNDATYVVFGKASLSEVDLRDFDLNIQGTAGYRIQTPAPYASDNYHVAGTQDSNGDGLTDVLIGIRAGARVAGSVFVVLGKTDPLPIDVTKSGPWGFRIRGAGFLKGLFPNNVDGVGDVNGDGLADVLAGSPYSRDTRGYAAVVYGKADFDEVRVEQLGDDGLLIVGRKGSASGVHVSGLGDMNNDGLGDFGISAHLSDFNGRRDSGSLYVIYGSLNAGTIRLARMGNRGHRIDGPWRGSAVSAPTAGLGDVNADGSPDVGLGNYLGDVAYLVWRKP